MSIIYLVVLMVMEVGQEDFIRSQMMAVYTIMIFQDWDWRICFQAINAHVSVSNNVVYIGNAQQFKTGSLRI